MKLLDWLHERTGYRDLVRRALDEPVPGGARFAYVWGSALALGVVVQGVTGVLLMTAYQPSATTAWSSVAYIQQQLGWGWLVRGLHHYGAQAMVILLLLHMGQTALYGAYQKPRELNWLFGLGLMALTLGFALTGYLLPWDQKGYWATKVATNIAGGVPLFGGFVQRLLVGGSDYGHLTLTRFYTLHVAVLPALLVLLLLGHVALFRRHGVTPPVGADTSRADAFFPKQLGKDLLVGSLVLALLFALAVKGHGAHLDAPADPASDYPARPEWYFLALFEALKHVPGKLEWLVAVAIPLLAGGYLAALPFVDREPGLRRRARWLAPLLLMLLGAAGLTWLSAAKDTKDPAFQRARAKAARQAERALELARQGIPPAGPLAMLAADPLTRGPALFDQHCAVCHALGEHGPKDDKPTAPRLDGFGTARWVLAMLEHPDVPELFGNTPFKGMMPSFVHPPADPEAAKYFTPMKPADRQAVAAFLAAEASGDARPGTMPGEKLVKARCTGCHRLDGKTPEDDTSLAPELRGWGSVKWIARQIADPASGATYPKAAGSAELKGHMPAFAEDLSEAEIQLLARWLAAAARGVPAP